MRRPPGRTLLVLLLLSAVGVLALYACSHNPERRSRPLPSPSPPARDVIRVGTLQRPAALPMWGLKRVLRMRGLKLDIQEFEDPGRMWELLAAGELDLVLTTLDQFALYSPRHDPGILIMPSALSQGADVVATRPEVRKVEELQGQRLAYVDGSAGGYLAMKLKSATGIRFTTVPARSAEEAARWLRQDQVQAAVLWQPWTAGFGALWSSEHLQAKEQILEVWVASHQILKGEGTGPEGLSTLAEAWFWVVERLNAQPFRATTEVDAIAEETGQDPATVQTILQGGLRFLGQAEAREYPPEALVRGLQDLRAEWSFQGEFEPPLSFRNVPPENIVDLTILDSLPPPESAPEPSPTPAVAPSPAPSVPNAAETGAPPPAEPTPSPAPSTDVEAEVTTSPPGESPAAEPPKPSPRPSGQPSPAGSPTPSPGAKGR